MSSTTDRPVTGELGFVEGRIQTGIPRLDFILDGGFLEGGAYVLVGAPGTGKTILANQCCFHHIRAHGGNCVYVTLLVESHAKMVRHLRGFSFFDTALIPDRMTYLSGYATLRDEGLDGLLALVRRALQDRKPTLLVIDGLETVDDAAEDPRGYREFIHRLQGTTAMLSCTMLLLSVPRQRHPENPLVDGVLELTDELHGPRAVRELLVHKFRGSGFLGGRHQVEINAHGIAVHPRTEVQFDAPAVEGSATRSRVAFGLPQLDEMLHGGVFSGSTTALLGAPGTGKTLIGLHFLAEGARLGEPCIYFGFNEPPPRLLDKSRSLGLDLEAGVQRGLVELIWQPPLEYLLDALAEQLLEKIRANPTPRRLLVDSLQGLRAASVYPDRMGRFLAAFTGQLRALNVTTVITEELDLFRPELALPNPELAQVVDTVVLLRYFELRSQLHRLLSVMKMRESAYDTSIREFTITEDGVDISGSFDTAEALLSGHPRDARLRGGGGEG